MSGKSKILKIGENKKKIAPPEGWPLENAKDAEEKKKSLAQRALGTQRKGL